jgi:hypothetical protein
MPCDRRWLVQSGTGEFGHVDLGTRRFEPVCFLQGFAQSHRLRGGHAVIGVFRLRESRISDRILVKDLLAWKGVGLPYQTAAVNLVTGDIEPAAFSVTRCRSSTMWWHCRASSARRRCNWKRVCLQARVTSKLQARKHEHRIAQTLLLVVAYVVSG